MLQGERVKLRGLTRDDLARIWLFNNDLDVELAGGGDPPMPQSMERLQADFDREAATGGRDGAWFAIEADAGAVLTDSGGIQEETTALGVSCITLRENTERPITVEQGTNTVVGTDPVKILACYEAVISGGGKPGRVPELWDGKAAQRIVDSVNAWVAGRE